MQLQNTGHIGGWKRGGHGSSEYFLGCIVAKKQSNNNIHNPPGEGLRQRPTFRRADDKTLSVWGLSACLFSMFQRRGYTNQANMVFLLVDSAC